MLTSPANGFAPVGYTYNAANGHWYVVNTALQSWMAARDAAAAAGGYLATITDANENAFVAALVDSHALGYAWTGGSDAGAEGQWSWDGGPEAGSVFWNGDVSGSAPVGGYENWHNQSGNPAVNVEPNGGTAENAMYIRNTGEWVDLAADGSGLPGHDPLASVIEISFVEDTVSFIPAGMLLANDTDVDSSPLFIDSVQAIDGQTHGSVELVDGNVRYTPDADYSGTASFTYRVKDANGAVSNEATVTFTVEAVNDAPEGDGNAPELYASAPEQTFLPNMHFKLAGIAIGDTEASTLRLTVSTEQGPISPLGPTTGLVTPDTDSDGSDGTLSFEGSLSDLNTLLAGGFELDWTDETDMGSLKFTIDDLQGGTDILNFIFPNLNVNPAMQGTEGKDLIVSNPGNDLLTGGAGADIFHFRSLASPVHTNADAILDFEQGVDKIFIREIDIDDIGDLTIAVEGGHSVIHLPNAFQDELTIRNITNLTAADFTFVPLAGGPPF
jgi:hypothetical protein